MDTVKPTYVKILLFFKKRPDITDEQFHSHWTEVHAAGAMRTIFSEKIRRYSQVCLPTPMHPSSLNVFMTLNLFFWKSVHKRVGKENENALQGPYLTQLH